MVQTSIAEQAIIAEVRRHAPAGRDVQVGIGDDAAVTRPPEGCDLLTVTDALVAGTHFEPAAPAYSVGYRALAVNLSDIAALGGEPLWASLALSVPEYDSDWIEQFGAGFGGLATAHDVALIGGDTVRGPLQAAVTVQGWVPRGTAVLRSGAAVGDLVCVTGFPGDAAAGRFLLEGRIHSAAGEADYLRGRFQYPQPRCSAGRELRGLATAMIDVSDGLDIDLRRLLDASGVGAQLDVSRLRCSSALLNACGRKDALGCALVGGEDYELAFTVTPRHAPEIAALAERLELPVAMLGKVTGATEVVWTDDGQPYQMPLGRFEHFQ